MPKLENEHVCGVEGTFGFGAAILKLNTNRPTYFIEKIPSGMAPDVFRKACYEAFNVWSLAGDIHFAEVSTLEGATFRVTIRIITGPLTFGKPPLAAATMPNSDGHQQVLALNSSWNWVVSASSYVGSHDVRHTLRHESGHIIGLSHMPDGPPKEIMDRMIHTDIFRPAFTEAAIVRKLYGPPKWSGINSIFWRR